MKRAYRKRKKKVKVNYKMLALLIVALVAAVAVFVGGIMLIAKAFSGGEGPTEPQPSQSSETPPQQSSEPASTEPQETKPEKPTGQVSDQPGEYSCFNDAAFIGDSRVLGLFYSTQITNAAFYCDVGMNVNTALNKDLIKLDNGSMGNVADALEQHKFGKIFLEFGVNELGWSSYETFQSNYEDLINKIKSIQPSATIYVQSVLPVTQAKSDENTYVNNENVETFNNMVKQAAANCHVEYVDVVPALCGESRVLPEDSSTDGVHLNKGYCYKWLNYLAAIVQ